MLILINKERQSEFHLPKSGPLWKKFVHPCITGSICVPNKYINAARHLRSALTLWLWTGYEN